MDSGTLVKFLVEQCQEHLLDIEDTESDVHPETQWVYQSHAVMRTALIFVDRERGLVNTDDDYGINPDSELGILGQLEAKGYLALNVANLLNVNRSMLYVEGHENKVLLKVAAGMAEEVLPEVNETRSIAPLVHAIHNAICETWWGYFEEPPATSFLNQMGESRGEILQFFWMWLISLAHGLE
jgi:hypothetical protein